MDEAEKKSYVGSVRRWAFLQTLFFIGLFYYIDGLPNKKFDDTVSNWETKTILDIKTSSANCPAGYGETVEYVWPATISIVNKTAVKLCVKRSDESFIGTTLLRTKYGACPSYMKECGASSYSVCTFGSQCPINDIDMKTLTLPRDSSSLEACQNSTNCLVIYQNSSSAVMLDSKRGSQRDSFPIIQLKFDKFGYLETEKYTKWDSECGSMLEKFLDTKTILATLKISQFSVMIIVIGRNLLLIFYITRKIKTSKTATGIMLIKEKWIDTCLARFFKALQDLIQIAILIFAVYNIFFRSGPSSSCSTDDLSDIYQNLNHNVQIALIGNVLASYFKVFLWMTNSFFFLSVQLKSEEEKKNPPDIEDPKPAPAPQPRQKRKDKRKKQKEEDNMQKPLLSAPQAAVQTERKKQFAKKQTFQPDEIEDDDEVYQPERMNQIYQPYRPENTNQTHQLYKPYQPN